jgi:alkylation response protein AidB-like acyl-CoA dehydrogenase
MDTRDTAEQAELRRAARQLARELGPATVADLDDATRTKRLAAAVRDAGWLELRDDDGSGSPIAGGVEAAIVVEALGATVADVACSGPLLAGDLARRARVEHDNAAVVFAPTLVDAARGTDAHTNEEGYAVDCGGDVDLAYVVVPDGKGYRLALARIDGAPGGADLTRVVRRTSVGAELAAVPAQQRHLTPDDLARWHALGLALTSADLVGVMRGVLDITVAYAAERRQYGVPIGSFQAVQHLLAEAHTLMEGSSSVALHASWAVDNLGPEAAVEAGRVAKAYCARAARTVCETAIQVHGGIGNTWECLAHVYLRRALLSTQWFGDDGEQLLHLRRDRLGGTDGLS